MVHYNSRGMAFTPFNLEVIAVQVLEVKELQSILMNENCQGGKEFLLCIKGGNYLIYKQTPVNHKAR